MSSRRSEEAGRQERAELAALADGTLAPERRAALEARVAASPELETLLAEQQHAIALLQGAASEVEAPAGLRRRIDARRNESRGLLSRRLVLAAGTAAAVAAAVLVLTVVNSGTTGQHYRTALAGTDLAPGAAGTATLTKTN